MASTKELFYRGLCYDFTVITNIETKIREIKEKLASEKSKELLTLLNKLTEDLALANRIYKNDIKYFGYTQADMSGKFKPKYLTDEELQADLIKDEKESKEKADYNFKALLEKAHELDKEKELQTVAI